MDYQPQTRKVVVRPYSFSRIDLVDETGFYVGITLRSGAVTVRAAPDMEHVITISDDRESYFKTTNVYVYGERFTLSCPIISQGW